MIRAYVSNEGEGTASRQVNLPDGSNGADLLETAGIPAGKNEVGYAGEVYTRAEFRRVALVDGQTAYFSSGKKATNGHRS